MDDTVDQLLETILARKKSQTSRRRLVGIAGPPGCGKSTIAAELVLRLNHHFGDGAAIALSLDGFHLTREQLRLLPDPDLAFARRGAPWTFDSAGLLNFVKQLRVNSNLRASERKTIFAPSFDHALKDPVPDDIAVVPTVSIVILEHLYLLLDENVWREVAPLLDYKVMVDVGEQCARDRVARRHVTAGIEPDIQSAWQRYDGNDALNGTLIRNQQVECDLVIKSIDGPAEAAGQGAG